MSAILWSLLLLPVDLAEGYFQLFRVNGGGKEGTGRRGAARPARGEGEEGAMSDRDLVRTSQTVARPGQPVTIGHPPPDSVCDNLFGQIEIEKIGENGEKVNCTRYIYTHLNLSRIRSSSRSGE